MAPKSYDKPPKLFRVGEDDKFEVILGHADMIELEDLKRNGAAFEGVIRHGIGMNILNSLQSKQTLFSTYIFLSHNLCLQSKLMVV